MNWRKMPINAKQHPLMAGILRRFGKAGYCAYQWVLDLYAIHFDSAGPDMPLVMDHKTLKKELDIKRWRDFWGILNFVNDWPAVGSNEKRVIQPTLYPNSAQVQPTLRPSSGLRM